MTKESTKELEFYLGLMKIEPNRYNVFGAKSALEHVLDAFDNGATKEDVSRLIRDYLPIKHYQKRIPSADDIALTAKDMCKSYKEAP